MSETDWIRAVIYFGSALSALLTFQKLIPQEIRRENRLTALLFASLGIILFTVGNVLGKVDQTFPHSIFLLLTSFSMIGPVTLLYTHALLYPNQDLQRDIRIHFVFPIIFIILEILFFARIPEEIVSDLRNFREIRYKHFLAISFLVTTFLTTGYFIARFRMLAGLSSVPEIKTQIRFIFILASITMIAMYSLVFGFMGGSDELFGLGGVLVALIVILLFLAPARYPDFFVPLTKEVRKRKYEKSLLVGVDLSLLELRIEELMRDKKLYRDPELTLTTLSEDLAIKPYQLTEFLNEHLNTGFYNYVNRYRIEEAVNLLRENPEQDVLSICYFVGFNSKSSFNDSFRKITGKTPSQTRKKEIV
ncbi:AraC family transcriptional regulator [Leptospira tipperaryensis]|uniref:AraC family transcriptional regulator n=1 Tax=Leptospira tipperaryensis TaxID=2564040 RepID=A0A1D7UVZ6_9LEPT|nr:helix-turn-helix domain-containing protein [Leptospira tipperaryensis]AOP33780.1 AraC family transcriptional regulator [Leptospira tipperaryensis]